MACLLKVCSTQGNMEIYYIPLPVKNCYPKLSNKSVCPKSLKQSNPTAKLNFKKQIVATLLKVQYFNPFQSFSKRR